MNTFTCTECKATFSDRESLRKHQFGHLYSSKNASTKDEIDLDSLRESFNSFMDDADEVLEVNKKAGYTHWIVRNNTGNCVIVPIGQPLPPNWTIYHTGSKPACESYWHTKCSGGAGGNKC